MPKRIAKENFYYAGRDVRAGAEVEIEEDHLELLLKTGKIAPDGNIEEFQASIGAAQTAEYNTRVMEAARPRRVQLKTGKAG